MTRMTRYVLGDLLGVFLVTLTLMSALMVLALLVQEAVKQGLGPEPIVRLLPYVLPQAMPFAIPAAILFAVCSVYGRMSSANEVVAIKSLGISPMSILWPAFVLAFLVSLSAVWLNDVAASWGRAGVQKVIMQSIEQIIYGTLRTHHSFSNGKISINVKEVDGKRLLKTIVTIQGGDGDPGMTITAEEAEIRSDSENNALIFIVTNFVVERGDNMRYFNSGTAEFSIPLLDASRGGGPSNSPAAIAMRQIPQEAVNQQRDILRQEESMAAEAAFQLVTGDFASLAGGQWPIRQAGLQHGRFRLHRLYAEPWRRWANGFCCFFFVFVGAPLAIHLRTSDLWTTFGLCFLPILVAYYPLMMYGVDRAKAGALPPYTVWMGNLVLLGIGFYFLRKVQRY